MKKSVLCGICEAKVGRYTCDRCGRLVCEDHYDIATDLCTVCRVGRFIAGNR